MFSGKLRDSWERGEATAVNWHFRLYIALYSLPAKGGPGSCHSCSPLPPTPDDTAWQEAAPVQESRPTEGIHSGRIRKHVPSFADTAMACPVGQQGRR